MNSRFLALKNSRLTHTFFLLSLFLLTPLLAEAQCPPTITVTNAPGCNVTFVPPIASLCSGDSCTLTSSVSAGTYQWYNSGTPIPDATSRVYYPTTAGNYTVLVDGCATPSSHVQVKIDPKPFGFINFSPPSPVCEGTIVEVELEADPGSPYDEMSWWKPDEISGNPNPFSQGFFTTTTIRAIVSNNLSGCTNVVSKTLVVHQPIDPGIINEDQTICSGFSPMELTGPEATGGDGVYTYQWQSSINSGITWSDISGATSLDYQPGILTQTTLFRRIVFNSSPCPAVTQYTPVIITVNEIPTVTSPAAVSICSIEALNYTPTSSVPGTTFAWTGVNTSGTVTGVSPSGTGSINDILSIPAGGTVSGTATYTIIPTGPAPTFCEGDPFYLVVTVLPLPIPTISGPTPVCFGSSGNLYATEPGMSGYVWTISPGGTINSGQGTYEISVTWTTTGPRWVRVIYTGGNTCAPLTPTQYNVTVNPLPDPIITGPNAPCLGASGNVYSTAAGMTNYIWNVSPGGTITGSGSPTDNTAIVTWNSTGVQWISLTYTDINGCTNTTPKQYLVNVSAPSLSGPQSPCLGSTGNVYTAGSGNTDYVWTVSPGGTITSGGGATNNTATITWNATGPQTVSVNYKTAAGCTAALPATLNVDVKPLPTPTINGNTNVCAGTTGVVYTTESGKSLYTWTVSAGGTITSGGTPGSNTATVTWNTAGPQQISVNYTDSNGCSAESATVYPVSVNTQPTPTILGSNSECVGTTGVVYSTEIGMSNYVWTISGGTITSGAGTNSVVVTWTAVGSRWVAVNYTGASGCNATAPTQYPVTVLPLPLPTVTGPNAVCVDATNVEYSTETGMSGYQWTVPTGGTIVGSSTNNTVFVTWNTVGSHTLSVTYTGTNGCAAATPTNYNVSVNPLPTPSITGPADVCRNSTANVYTTQPGMTNYVWSISGGTITAGGNGNNTATVTWNTTGNQSISVNYEQTGCPATSPTVYPVFVNPLPIVDAGPAQSIQNGTSTVLNGTASGGTGLLSYQWTPVNLIASGATSLMPTTENIYVTQIFDLEVTDSKLCASSDQVVITALGDPLSVAASATPDIICNNGATVQLGATANGGNSSFQADYSWTSTPAGFTSNAQNPIANPTVTTTYNVSVWDGFNTATNTILVTVNPLPTVYSVTGGGEYCAGGLGVSVGLNGSQTGVSYQLLLNGSDIGAPISGTGGAISFTNNTAAGVYTIRAINGTTTCERNMAGSVTISINPLPTSFAGNSELIPYGTNTTLTGVAGAGTPPYNYLWTPAVNINGSNTSLTATTTNLFTNTDFTFRVTDSKNCVANDIVSITLDGSALAVTATAVEDIICNNGETVQLNASATGGNSATQVNYSWTSTPAGFTSTAQSPQVNPTQTTIYYISVNDGFNTATNSVTVTVNPLPTPFTVTGGGEYCNGGGGLAVGLNGSQLGVNYQLLRNGSNIGASVAGTGAAISFGNHTNAGLYTVHATNSTTTCERTMTGSTSIAVNPLPVASAGVDKSINHGTSTTLNGSASSGTSPWTYSWTPINRINSGANTSTPVTENLFTTTAFDLTVTDAKGCTDTDQMQVIVLGNPLSVNASVNNSTICSGATAQLSATGSGGNLIYTYSWSSNPAGWTSTEQNPVINPTVTTDYTVTINDGYNTATSSVNVFVNPLATVYNVTGGGSYCSGDAGVAVGLSNSEIGVNYQLYRNGTSVGSAVSGTGSPISFGLQTGAGSYTVKATTAITGCENDMAATVDVNTLPLPNVYTMTGGGSYPQGGIGVIVGITNSQIGVNYQLLLNGNDIGAAVAGTGSPLDFGYQTGAGVYTAIGIDAVTGCDIEMSSTATVIINPYPSIFHVYGGGSICAGSSVEVGLDGSEIGVAYTLSRNGTSVLVGIPGTGDSLHFGSFSTQGIYTVRAQNISTGLTRNMDGNAEIIVNPLPIPYSLSYFQPGDNCAPIIPRLGGSEIGAVYELNYEDFNGFYTAAIETINGTGNPFNFSSQTNPGIYTVSAYIDYTNVICRIDMIGSLVADSLPKEFQITPQGQLCENDQELCLAGSEAGINYRLWLNGQPVGAIVPGDINGGPICFGTLNAPGTYRINAINTITGCEIFYTNQVVVNPQPIKYVMSPVADCAGSEIILEDCELGIDYYLYHEPATKEFIEVQGPLTCTGSGPIDFGPQVDEGVYRIKAVNPATNCWAWMDGSTTIYPNPEIFDISPQSGGCAPIAIYLEDFEADATYYLYRGATLVSSIAGSSGSVNFGLQNVAGTYTVTAKITHPGGLECWSDMSGEVIIYNSATVFTLTPQGPSCPDPAVTFRLSGSEPAVNYTLWHDASGVKETIVGTGLAFNFSPQSEPGQYWVIASTGNACQTQMNGMGVIHEIPALYTITPSGQFCSNDDLEIGLSNSELGVTYRLYRANTAITPPVIVAGTGNAISFGTNNWVAGTYTVMAVDDVTGCDRLMDGTLVISNPPNIYAVLANGVIATSGLYCAPSTIGLALSQLGVDYTLHSPDGNNTTLAGTGFPLDFGPFSYPGEYSITAFNSATSCSSLMSGTVNIYDDPEVFVLVSLTDPLYCFGDNSAIELVLNYSQIGASYQLYRDTDANPVFAAQPGTGGSLSWTAVSQYGPGDYYVKSSFIADPTCSAVMDGVIPVEEIDLPTAALSGTQTICSTYCTDLVFNITAAKAFTLTYSANNQLQAPVSFNPGDDFRVQVCPTVNTEYEIQSIEYTEFPYCIGTDISGTFDVIVEPLPAITVNNPGTTCIATPYLTSVVTENTVSYEWIIINGNGSISVPNNTENITYTPAAGDEGTTVVLQLTAFGVNTCSAESVSELVEINVEPIPQIDMGSNGLICETGTFTTNTTIDFGSAYLWEIVSGNGTINPIDQPNTRYTAAAGDGGNLVQLRLSVTGEGTCVNETVSDVLDIIIEPLPTADAGAGGVICESETFQLNGSATNHTTVLWEVIDGSGTFDNPSVLNAIFTPADISNNTSMRLRLTAAGTGTCNSEIATSEVIINVDPLPEAYAGLGGVICETQGYHFATASVRNNSSFVWEIQDGAGHFDDPLHLSPVFYPDPVSQITDMTLRLVAYGINNCSNATDTSFVTITVHPQPVAYAGAGGETCVNMPFALTDASAQHQRSVLWEVVSGAGHIDSPLNVNPNYIPNAADAETVVTLKLTAYGAGPCSAISTNDFVNIFIQGLPTVDAGPNLQTCFLDPVTITQASASNYEQILWTHDGNGTLNNSNTISPTYIPAAGDEGNTITLTLSAEGMSSCAGELATDQTTILVAPLPTAFAGLDATICELENYTILDASATFESSVVWSVINGSGSITQPFLVNTTYIPAASDAGTTVRLRLTVYGRGNCAAYSSFDEINISVVESPIALFSVDTPVCENEVVSFTDQSSTTAGIIEQWVWDFGDGSAPITINFPDNPNATHTYTISGAYTVSLLATTTNGCTDLYSTEINISPAPVAAFDYNGGLCAESEVNFIDLSQVNGGGNIMSWNWNFGDGAFSTEQNPSHIFNAAGDYVVSLTVTNMANCVSQPFVQTITIGDPITVTIDDTDLIACLNESHQFNGISPEAVYWNWDFGDGTSSTLQNPTHTYTSIGNYTVTLTGSDINGCQNVDVVTLTVRPNPIAFFTADQSACVNEEIDFIDASISPNGQIVEWLWEMGDGTVIGPITNPADRNVVHQYAFAGSYEVELTVTDVNGCTDVYARILVIENGPLANFTFEAACEGQAVIFTDLSTPNGGSDLLSWQWNFGDPLSGTNNTSNLQNPSHIFVGDMLAGGYVVTLTVTNTQGCFNSIPLPVEVNQNQTITILADPNPICLGNPILFSSDATNVVSWQWNFGDGSTSAQPNPAHSYQFAGNYNVILTIQDGNGCTATANLPIEVNELPTANFSNTAPGCLNETISFTDLSISPNGAIVDWQWDFGDGNNSNLQNPDNQYLAAGTFIVSLSVTDATGCTDTYQKTISIQTAPIANFAYEAACLGHPVIFTDLSSVNNGSNIIGWQWNFGDPASGTANNSTVQNPTHIFVGNMPAGGFTVSLTITNVEGCTDIFETQVELNEAQTITITTDNDIHCLSEIVQFNSNATNVESWLWNFGDGNTSTQANPTHIYQFTGTYNVTLNIRDANGCTASDAHQVKVNELPTADFSNSTPGCPDETIYFTDLSISPNGGIVNWHWEFGDGDEVIIDAPDNPNVEHIYANPGTYNVTLTVTDVTGCEDSFNRQIVTENAPLANFTFTQTCFGEPVLFTDLSSPNGGSDLFSWAWDFGDPLSGVNNSSTLQNPSHLFTTAGVYTVSLTVTNTQGCSDTFTAEITVSETVDIDFDFDAVAFCPGEIINFTPIGDNIVSYNWSFGDGGTSIQQTPIYIYTQPGTYTVSLLVTAIDGCQGYVEHDVVINEEPIAAFSTDSPTCNNSPTHFFNASSSPTGHITEWIWNFGDGSPEVIVAFPDNPDLEYTYTAIGTYNATLTVTNTNGCSNSISHEVVVAPGPVAAFDHNGSCAESPVSFIDLSQENGGGIITGWQWNFGDLASGTANTSTLQNPEHSFTAPGNYDVELIITNINGCTASVTNTITIDEALLVEITVDNETPCLGTSVNFSGTAAGAVIWHWDFGDGNTANGQNTTHTYTETGSFTVVLTAETPEGCSNTATLTMVVNPAPVSRFISTSPACSSDSVHFVNQSTTPNGFIQTYIWDMGDGNVITVEAPADPNIAHLYAIPGTYEVSLTVIDNSGCENTSSKLVQVEAGPIADFTQDESCFGTPTMFTDLTSTNGGTDLYSWQWWFGDPNSGINNTSTLQNPSHRFTEAGTYTVTLIVTNTSGCSHTIEKEVIVKALPEVDFTIVNDQLCLNTAAEFNGIGENINTWFWEFGDGGTSYGQNTTYMYAEPGQYTVTLTVTGVNQCQNSVSYPIFINDAPIADFRVDNTCLDESTQFFDQSISLYGFIEAWEWDFGDGNNSTEQNPEHVFENADDYLVSLTVTDNFGCFETISRWVSIYEKPTAAFSFNQVCDPEGKVFFFNESEISPNGSPIMVYHWSFHDGYSSSDINPNHIFPEPGTCYEVSLTITDAFGCESTATQEICIWETLTIDFTSTEVCQGFPTEFEASYLPEDDEIVSYAWDFNDGSDIFLTFEETTSHIFPQAGTYFVELTATNINGCEKTIYREVKVNGLPLPDFSYEPGLCDDPVAFTDLSDGNGALVEIWLWDFGDPDSGDDNFSDLRNPSHLYNDQGGTYQVKLTVTNFNGCEASITKEVIQDPCVQASFIVPNVTLCADATICFIDESHITVEDGSIDRWIWNFGDNTPNYEYTELENPVCHEYSDREGGDFVVSLTIEATVNGSPFSHTHTETITIYPKPTARFIPEPVCQNTRAQFTDNSLGNGSPITNWFWDFGDETTVHDTSSMKNTSYKYPGYGLFDVQLVVSNAFDCTDTLISEIEIYQPPTADFIAVDSCATYITYFNDLTVTGGASITNYFWHFGDPGSNNSDGNHWTDSTSTDRWAEHIYNSPGTYFATLIVEDGNSCRDTVRHSLPVHPIPIASFTYEDRYQGKQGQVLFENTSDATATSFFWDFMTAEGDFSNEENPVFQFKDDGIYDVMLIAYNNHMCPDTAINPYEIVFTGLYFPNTFIPNSEDPKVNKFMGLGENLQTYQLEVYTSWGQLIWSSTALIDGKPAEAWDGTYNNQDLPIGSYIWKASASFKDGTIWEGSDNGDGNLKTYGILNLIR